MARIRLDDGSSLALAQVRPYTRTERGRTQQVGGYQNRRMTGGYYIPSAKWKEGQLLWAQRGEAARKAAAAALEAEEAARRAAEAAADRPSEGAEKIAHGVSPEGFSLDIKTGAQPKGGYMVARIDQTHTYPASIMEDREQLARAIDKMIMTEHIPGGTYLGGWVHDGKLWLEPSDNIEDRAEAEKLGHERNQVAIWDVANSEEIQTGGTGGGKITDHSEAPEGKAGQEGGGADTGGIPGPAGGGAAGGGQEAGRPPDADAGKAPDLGLLKEVTMPSPAEDSLGKHTGPGGVVEPARQKLHQKIAAGILKGHKSQKSPVAVFLGGGPAAGKSSTMAGAKKEISDLAVIAADDIKPLLPEYQQMEKAGGLQEAEAGAYVHRESNAVADKALAAAIRQRVNFMLDGTGDSDYGWLSQLVRDTHSSGFHTSARYVTTDTDEAIRRAEKRAETTGRMVPESVIRLKHGKVSAIFARAMQDDLFDSAQLYDNNGAKPRLIAEKKPGGQFTVLDQPAWQKFLAKGKPYVGAVEKEARAAEAGRGKAA